MNVGAVLELESTHLRKTDNHLEFVENKYETYSSLHSYIKRIPGRSSFFFLPLFGHYYFIHCPLPPVSHDGEAK